MRCWSFLYIWMSIFIYLSSEYSGLFRWKKLKIDVYFVKYKSFFIFNVLSIEYIWISILTNGFPLRRIFFYLYQITGALFFKDTVSSIIVLLCQHDCSIWQLWCKIDFVVQRVLTSTVYSKVEHDSWGGEWWGMSLTEVKGVPRHISVIFTCMHV